MSRVGVTGPWTLREIYLRQFLSYLVHALYEAGSCRNVVVITTTKYYRLYYKYFKFNNIFVMFGTTFGQ